MDIISVTKARSDLFNLIEDVILGTPKCISTKNGNAVIISQTDWDSIQETLYIMSNQKLHEEIKDRMKTPIDDCIEELNW
jgi:prevent-host-death family protein